jgi:MoxR-like ATPase
MSSEATRQAPQLEEVRRLATQILDQVERVVVGKRETLELVLIGILADGHVLLEDNPGLAKTLLARSFAQVLRLDFTRIQFTPDLMPADITGSAIFDPGRLDFEFRPGPIFGNLLLADEINRAPAKTQAALLEAMQEHQVTVDGTARPLPEPFSVLATQNPIEYEGTYPLPEAQLDRFLLRTGIGYPTQDQEVEVLRRRVERGADDLTLTPQASGEDILRMRQAIESVEIDPDVARYIVQVVAATRASGRVQVGASPRGSLALLKLSRCRAALQGRTYVVPEDVKSLAVAALAHRLSLRPELWVQNISGESVVADCLEQVPVPRAR